MNRQELEKLAQQMTNERYRAEAALDEDIKRKTTDVLNTEARRREITPSAYRNMLEIECLENIERVSPLPPTTINYFKSRRVRQKPSQMPSFDQMTFEEVNEVMMQGASDQGYEENIHGYLANEGRPKPTVPSREESIKNLERPRRNGKRIDPFFQIKNLMKDS